MTNRTPVVAGNWKMNPTSTAAAVALALGVRDATTGLPVRTVVCPPAVFLPAVAAALGGGSAAGGSLGIGAQTMRAEESGAYTGEISPLMLRGVAQYVIVGHSERRQFFGETDESVNRRARAALAAGLKPIVCVGERLEERQAGSTHDVVARQLEWATADLTADRMRASVVAYEPVWAIGTGKVATPAQAQEVHALLRRILVDKFGAEVARDVRIQYGGSVKPDNAAELLAQTDIDGALVGGASLDAESFGAIVCAAEEAAGT
jgi:triosephosphate isomerase